MDTQNKHVHEAYAAIFQQDFRRAIDSFRKAIRLNPKNASLYYKLSITYARNQDLDKAIQSIKEAIRLADHDQTYFYHYQHLMIQKLVKDAQKALDDAQEAHQFIPQLLQFIEVDPLHVELKWTLGLLYAYSEQWEKADEQMKAILAIDQEHQQALHYFIARGVSNQHVH